MKRYKRKPKRVTFVVYYRTPLLNASAETRIGTLRLNPRKLRTTSDIAHKCNKKFGEGLWSAIVAEDKFAIEVAHGINGIKRE